MATHRCWLVLLLLLFIPTSASAHTHRWDIFFGGSYANASNLGGLHVAFAFVPPVEERYKKVSVVADTSFHFGTHENVDLTRTMVAGGVRLTPHGVTDRHLTSVQVLVGVVRDKTDLFSDTGFGATFGALYEYLPGLTGEGWAFRAQGDFVVSTVDKFPRLSAGLAYHWK